MQKKKNNNNFRCRDLKILTHDPFNESPTGVFGFTSAVVFLFCFSEIWIICQCRMKKWGVSVPQKQSGFFWTTSSDKGSHSHARQQLAERNSCYALVLDCLRQGGFLQKVYGGLLLGDTLSKSAEGRSGHRAKPAWDVFASETPDNAMGSSAVEIGPQDCPTSGPALCSSSSVRLWPQATPRKGHNLWRGLSLWLRPMLCEEFNSESLKPMFSGAGMHCPWRWGYAQSTTICMTLPWS